MFRFSTWKDWFVPDNSDPVYSAILQNTLQCPDEHTCFIWAAVYHNVSVVMKDLDVETYRAKGNCIDENNRPLLCELEGGVTRTFELVMSMSKGTPFFEFMDDVLSHIIERGFFLHIKKRSFEKLEMESRYVVPTFDDTYYVYALNIRHLQTAFYMLMLGYVLAIACFVTEIVWYWYSSNCRAPVVICLCDGRT
jgi:hypothetical protein